MRQMLFCRSGTAHLPKETRCTSKQRAKEDTSPAQNDVTSKSHGKTRHSHSKETRLQTVYLAPAGTPANKPFSFMNSHAMHRASVSFAWACSTAARPRHQSQESGMTIMLFNGAPFSGCMLVCQNALSKVSQQSHNPKVRLPAWILQEVTSLVASRS